MTARIDYFGISEAAATDARGIVTLVGFSPMFQVHPQLPSQTSLVMVLVLMDEAPEELDAGQTINLSFTIKDPEGNVMAGVQQPIPLGEKLYKDLPGSLMQVVGAQVALKSYGRHSAEVVVETHGGTVLRASRDLWIMAGLPST